MKEVTYGDTPTIKINLDSIIMLPQVRKTKNEKLEIIKESILEKSLINQVDIVLLTKEELDNHIDFLARVWEVKIENDFKPLKDGKYPVLIAGHTRCEALKTIQKEKKVKVNLIVKSHKLKSSEEILSFQLDENLHTEPNTEERAIALISLYKVGMELGKWSNKNEFIKAMVKNSNEKLSEKNIKDAVDFSNLPLLIQKHVFEKNIQFTLGVELGKMYYAIESYLKSTNNLNEYNIICYYSIILAAIRGKSVKKGIQIISGYLKELELFFGNKKEQYQIDLFGNIDKQGRYIDKVHDRVYNEVKSEELISAAKLLNLDTRLTGSNHSDVQKIILETLNEIQSKTI